MKKNFIPVVFSSIIFFSCSIINFAQESFNRSWGISASINNSQGDILLPIWLDKTHTLAPSIGIISVSDKNTDLSLGWFINIISNTIRTSFPF